MDDDVVVALAKAPLDALRRLSLRATTRAGLAALGRRLDALESVQLVLRDGSVDVLIEHLHSGSLRSLELEGSPEDVARLIASGALKGVESLELTQAFDSRVADALTAHPGRLKRL